MFSGQDRSVLDLYEVLDIPRDSTTAHIQEALARYRARKEIEQNNPYTMQSASTALRVTIPAVESWLLGEDARRQAYDRRLALSERGGHGLDLDRRQRIPFYLDPWTDDYDTEEAVYTLREMAALLDRAWPRTRSWLLDTSRPRHALLDYLKHVACLPDLAERIETEIFQRVRATDATALPVDEAIERCLLLIDPELPRPRLLISAESMGEAGELTLDVGAFLPDEHARGVLTLSHGSERGCVFGMVDSHSEWLAFPGQQSRSAFSLLPASEACALPLILDMGRLAHPSRQQGLLTVCVQSDEPPVVSRVNVLVRVLPLPPRVSFEPVATVNAPASAGKTRRGIPGRVAITGRNRGDERVIPLVAALSTDDPAVRLSRTTLVADTQLEVTIDTRRMPYGSSYRVAVHVDYSPTPGARGPRTLYICGEILPTVWQSLLRSRSLQGRLKGGLAGGIIGFFGIGIWQALLVVSSFVPWFLALPLILVAAFYLAANSVAAHWPLAGLRRIRWTALGHALCWGGALGAGLLCDWIGSTLSDRLATFLLAGGAGGLLCALLGFALDGLWLARAPQ